MAVCFFLSAIWKVKTNGRPDLHPRNILFALPQIDSMFVEEIYKNFNRPQETKVCRVDGGPLGLGVPSHTVVPASVVIPCHKVQDPRIRISDFGGACLMTDKSVKADLQTPVLYLPPEAILATKSVGFPADIWTLACSIYEIMGDTTLFSGFYPDKDDIVAEMISCLGLLPHDWWKIWGARGEFFEEDGSWRAEMDRAHDSKSRPLSQRIREMGRENDCEFSTEEAKYLEQMLETMLQYKPEDRATIEDVVKSEWMTRWGMPSLEIFNITVPYEP